MSIYVLLILFMFWNLGLNLFFLIISFILAVQVEIWHSTTPLFVYMCLGWFFLFFMFFEVIHSIIGPRVEMTGF